MKILKNTAEFNKVEYRRNNQTFSDQIEKLENASEAHITEYISINEELRIQVSQLKKVVEFATVEYRRTNKTLSDQVEKLEKASKANKTECRSTN